MNDEQEQSERAQQLIESLKELWQYPYLPSPDQMQRIIEFVVHFPEPYRAMAMTEFAEHLVNSMGLHYLDLMTTFRQKAEEEGIDQKEREGTYQDIMAELYPTMMQLSRNISVHSLNDLVTLSNISSSLYELSQADSAEEAQDWMYTLPKVYHNQLARERLIGNLQSQETVSVHAEITTFVINQPQIIVIGQATFTGDLPGSIVVDPARPNIIDSTEDNPAKLLVA